MHAPADTRSDFLSLIPHEYARRHLILGAGLDDGHEVLWVSQGTLSAAIFNVRVRLGRPVKVIQHEAELLAGEIDRAYSVRSVEKEDDDPAIELAGMDAEGVIDELDGLCTHSNLLDTEGKGPVIRLVDLLFFEALQRRASDIHIQALSDRVLVRYRLDGVLQDVRQLPAAASLSVISRIKVMARMDVAERRAPQDGRATVTLGRGREGLRRVDLRISTLPTTYGERVVIRILDASASAQLLNFAALGMPREVESKFLTQVGRANGIALVTGPTGSGKTTTLYTTLAWLAGQHSSKERGCELNMMTIEDPVEYDLSTAGLAISQTQLNTKRGVTFAAGLRHILRQDPDVIMVGEIRDEETAKIAVQASLTGHLVLSTMHTNDAPSAAARLLDLAVEPYLVSSSLNAVLAQRLVRTVHQLCAGTGCTDCTRTGFKGRTGLFELLAIDDAVREAIGQRASSGVIKQLAISGQGMRTLSSAGSDLVREGRTTAAECARVLDAAGVGE